MVFKERVAISASELMKLCSSDGKAIPQQYVGKITVMDGLMVNVTDLEVEGGTYFFFSKEMKVLSWSFFNCGFEKVQFWSSAERPYATFTNCDFHDLEIGPGTYGKLDFQCLHGKRNTMEALGIDCSNGEVKGDLTFSTYDIKGITIHGTTSEALRLEFNSVIFTRLRFQELINRGKLRFINSAVAGNEASFVVYQSNLDGCAFHNFDLSTAQIGISSADLSGAVLTGLKWPKKDQIFRANSWGKLLPQSGTDVPELVEFFRQLKHVYAAQGDIILEHDFHAREMVQYQALLKWNEAFWTKLVIKLSDWTSGFGQSLIRPLLFIILVNGASFFVLIHLDSAFVHFKPVSSMTLNDFWLALADFMRFSNPLHKNEPEFRGLPFIVDTFMRIISSYGLYNVIRATRRFVK